MASRDRSFSTAETPIFSARRPRGVAFLFPGQGAQRIDMGRELYIAHPVFREEIDRCCELLQPDLGLDLRTSCIPPGPTQLEAADKLMQTSLTQPALFVVEYAHGADLALLGLRPRIMTGHSLGEYVAAALAGVFPLGSALHLLAVRGRLMQSLPSARCLPSLPKPKSRRC